MELNRKKRYKKIFVLFLSFALMIQSIYMPNQVKASTQGDFTYEVRNDNTAVITGFSNTSATKVVIPNNFGGVRVTEIANYAFVRKIKIQELVIPDTITKIGDNAFFYNTSLKKLVIPGSVKYIGANAFANCTSLEKLTILYGVETVSRGAFANCTKLSFVEIGPSVGTMQGSTFQKVTGMTMEAEPNSPAASYNGDGNTSVAHQKPADDSPVVYAYETAADGTVVIKEYVGSSATPEVPANINGNKVTGLGNGSFHNKPVNSVTLPDSIKTLGDDVFTGTNITELILPAGVSSIGKNLIDDIEGIVIKSDSPYIEDYISEYFTNIRFEPYKIPISSYYKVQFNTNNGKGKITLGKDGYYKDGYKIHIKAVPSKGWEFKEWTVSGIGTFEDATSAETIFNMSSTDVTLTANFVKAKRADVIYENGVFKEYNTTGHLVIQEMYAKSNEDETLVPTTAIASNAFAHLVYEDNQSQWYHGYPLTITFPTTMKTIPNSTFNGCDSLTGFTVTEPNIDFTTENGVLFNDDKTVLIAYPKGNTAKDYVMPNTVKEIASNAFYENSYLENITFSNQLAKIHNYAFYNAQNLKEINLPDTVKEIGVKAFWDIDSLKKVYIKAGVTTIGECAFNYSTSLEMVKVSESNPKYMDESGILFEKDTNKLLVYPSKKVGEQYSIKEGTKIVGSYAFYMSPLKEIIIPNSVKTIGSYAFSNCKVLPSIKIPNSVTTIGEYAFSNCEALLSITIPNSVITIGEYAFSNCKALLSITIPNSVTTIENSTFENCITLKSIEIPNSVTTIESYAFDNCVKLPSITIPNSVTTIESYAFDNCVKLPSITIPNSVKTIGSYAFRGCTSLPSIEIPDSVTSIGDGIFFNCNNLNTIKVNIGNKHFIDENGILYELEDNTTNKTKLICYPMGKTDIKEYKVAEGTKNISTNAFAYTQIEKIDLPETIISLGFNTLPYCSNLSEVIMRNDNIFLSISSNSDIFYGTDTSKIVIVGNFKSNAEEYALEKGIRFRQLETASELVIDDNGKVVGYKGNDSVVIIPGVIKTSDNRIISVTSIGSNAFKNPDNPDSKAYEQITEVHMPYSINTIEDAAFDGCKNLTDSGLKLPMGLTTIGGSAFKDCSSLTKITIPSKVSSINTSAFDGCTSLTEIQVEDKNSNYSSINGVLTNKDKTILCRAPIAFSGNNGEYQIPDSVTALESNSMEGCTKINSINFNKVVNINAFAFKNAFINPIEIDLGRVTDIDNNAFENCTGITKITIPVTVTRIGYNVFYECNNLKQISVAPENTTYADKDGVLFRKDMQILISYPIGNDLQTYSIPNSVYEINDNAFYGAKNLTTINMPNTLLKIGNGAFSKCAFLNINLSKGLEKIGDNAFSDCGNLTDITIPSHVKSIGASAFSGCANLANVYVYSRDMQYGKGVFNQELTNQPYLTLHGYTNSTTESYAEKNNIPFVLLKADDVNREILQQTISDANTIHNAAVEGSEQGQYAAGSKATLKTAITLAEGVAENQSPQAVISTAITDLKNAMKIFASAMVPYIADKSQLLALFDEVSAIYNSAVEGTQNGQFPVGSKAVLLTEINKANIIIENASASQGDTDLSFMNLKSALVDFQRGLITSSVVKFGELSAGITIAKATYNAAVEGNAIGNYEVGSKAIYLAAIELADEKLKNLSSASLEYIAVPTSNAAINMPIHNTSASGVNFDFRSNTTQDQVNEAVKELVRAGITFENSKNRPVNLINTSSLKLLIGYTDGLYYNAVEGTAIGNYPIGKKAEFKAVIDSAYQALFLTNPLQSEIDYHYNMLQQAINIFEASKITEN